MVEERRADDDPGAERRRAQPVDLAGSAQAAEEVVGDQVRPDAVAPGPQRRQVVVVVAVAEAREAVARVHAVDRVLKQAVQVAGRGDRLPDVARPRREREPGDGLRVAREQRVQAPQHEHALVVVGVRGRAGRGDVVAVGHRVPGADLEARGEAPLHLGAHALVAGEEAPGPQRAGDAVRHAVVERGDGGHRLVVLVAEPAVEVAPLGSLKKLEKAGRTYTRPPATFSPRSAKKSASLVCSTRLCGSGSWKVMRVSARSASSRSASGPAYSIAT